jgi:hypothetical protein
MQIDACSTQKLLRRREEFLHALCEMATSEGQHRVFGRRFIVGAPIIPEVVAHFQQQSWKNSWERFATSIEDYCRSLGAALSANEMDDRCRRRAGHIVRWNLFYRTP